MLRRGEGRIVNVTSAAVHTSTPVSGWYQACKAALRELTDALRLELATTGIDVVDLEPGGFATGIWPRAADELRRRQAVSDRPRAYDRPLSAVERYQDRMGDPTAVAEAIVTALTSSRVRNHRRVGHDALPLRIAADVLPDRIWDRISSGLAGVR
jgi:NAD(P)-dependent dehydrogenase (short-subunit alcohol dehydrogenase family)